MAKKFYAVRKGHKPGIYDSWEAAEKEVRGFSGAEFKAFGTYDEAVAHTAGSAPPTSYVEVHDAGRVARIELTSHLRAALKAAGVCLGT